MKSRAERRISTLLGFCALLAFIGLLLATVSCACTPDRPGCTVPFPNAAPRQ